MKDVEAFKESLNVYEKASSARVNWNKSEGFIMGNWQEEPPPVLPGGVKLGKEGLKFFRGIFREGKIPGKELGGYDRKSVCKIFQM